MADYMQLDNTYRLACSQLAEKNPTEIAWKAQASYDKENTCFYLPFYQDRLVISYPGGAVSYRDREEEVPVTEKILVLHYLLHAQGVPLTQHWVTFREIPGGDIYVDPFKGRSLYPFLKTFGKAPEDFARAATSLGGTKRDMGTVGFEIPVFPMVKVIYILWLGDEEVPPSANILFNETAPFYLPTEDYAIIGGMTTSKLRKAL